MGLDKLVKLVIDNIDRIGFVGLLAIVLVSGIYGWITGKLISPAESKRRDTLLTESTTTNKAAVEELKAVREELTESRILHEAAKVRIEFLERENAAKDKQLVLQGERITRLEAQADTLREVNANTNANRNRRAGDRDV